MSANRKPLIVSIEGNIGTGKSTLLSKLRPALASRLTDDSLILFLEEPVNMWEKFRDETGQTILEKFYKDQRRYAFTFQVMAYISRLSLLKNAIAQNPTCEIIIIERSLCADKNIFMDMLHDDGIVEDIEYNIYAEWYREFIDEYRMDAVVYLDSSPETCHRRISKRNRQGEDGIPLAYLEKCAKYHTDWLVNTKCSDNYVMCDDAAVHTICHEDKNYKVLHIDTNAETDYVGVESKGCQWLDAICSFIITSTFRDNL
jgi:deoxyadenosine/deoxycytidine kinase